MNGPMIFGQVLTLNSVVGFSAGAVLAGVGLVRLASRKYRR
jgi:hypothetical protein